MESVGYIAGSLFVVSLAVSLASMILCCVNFSGTVPEIRTVAKATENRGRVMQDIRVHLSAIWTIIVTWFVSKVSRAIARLTARLGYISLESHRADCDWYSDLYDAAITEYEADVSRLERILLEMSDANERLSNQLEIARTQWTEERKLRNQARSRTQFLLCQINQRDAAWERFFRAEYPSHG
jgi:predicted RNase H-like nuclease (RuvC/YqgF family)